jgi:DNA-binding NtrC family response regulator
MEVISSVKKTETNSKNNSTVMSNNVFEVVVIEDNHLINTIMSKALESTINSIKNLKNIPVTFSSFHNGGDFLNYFENKDFSNSKLIVFSDYHLEDNMNGIEILRNVKRRKSEATVIIMSDSANKQISIDSEKMGAYCFLPKDSRTTVICSELLFQMVV